MPGIALFLALTAAAGVNLHAVPSRIEPKQAPPAIQAARGDQSVVPVDGETHDARPDAHARLTVPVHIEGHGPFRFLIDTGSQRTVLSTSLARKLGLRDGPQLRVIGMVEAASVPSAQVETLDLGQLGMADMLVPLLEDADMGADGIIGTDTLQDQRVLLDFDSEQIEVGDAASLGGNRGFEIVVRARRKSGQLIMTDARIDGISVAVVLDTGAQASIGNRALQRALGRRSNHFTPVTITSVTGHSVVAELGTAGELSVHDIAIRNPAIAFVDTIAFAELGLDKKPALFLGMRELRVFRRVAIDFAKRRVLFDLPRNL